MLAALSRPPFVMANPGSQRGRLRGVALAVTWLSDQPGETWQQRWQASGVQAAGADWKQACEPWLDARGVDVRARLDLLSIGVNLMVCADLIRPALGWLAAPGISCWALARNLQATRDPTGFARLRAACRADPHASPSASQATMGRAAVLVAAKGGTLNEVTAGDFLQLLDVESGISGRPRDYSAVSWRLLHQIGVFGPGAPAALAELRTIGQRSPAELIDRYRLACRPVRDLLVAYLQERQSALDHNSLDTLAQQLGRAFWQDIERHHPGIDTWNLPAPVAAAWKQRLRTRPATPAATITSTLRRRG